MWIRIRNTEYNYKLLDLPDGMLASFLLPSAASSATDFPARAATTYQIVRMQIPEDQLVKYFCLPKRIFPTKPAVSDLSRKIIQAVKLFNKR
jgi:hypothetical protein